MNLQKVMENLRKNNIKVDYVKNEEELKELLNLIIKDKSLVALGGSMTLFETGVIEYLRNRDIEFLDRYRENLTKDDINEMYRRAFYSDYYFTSSNAITENGELYNVDGNGNRVSAMIWGPKKVVVIAGINKIVKDEKAAVERNRKIAAPKNAKRLKLDTPCAKLGYCVDCNHKDRICASYVMLRKQRVKDRIHVILVEGEWGY